MGRKKSRPIRSGGISEVDVGTKPSTESDVHGGEANVDDRKPCYINIDRSHLTSDENLDIAEVVLNNANFTDGVADDLLIENNCREADFSMRFCLYGVEEGSFRLGHWPVLSADNISLECVVLENHALEDSRKCTIFFSGKFDGPDEGISGLIHLVSQKFLAIRLILEGIHLGSLPSVRLRVEVLRSAFDSSGSLLNTDRQTWRKSMMNVMSWLRPEVTTSEAVYGIKELEAAENPNNCSETDGNSGSNKHVDFDVAGFYEAIKPSKNEPMLEDKIPDLLPDLRPYQRRAAYWMVQREKGDTEALGENAQNQLIAPFCVPVTFLERHSKLFYNPFNGSVSLHPESFSSYVSGGILADEMGLGKTVELLACIFSHRRLSLEDSFISDDDTHDIGSQIKRQKRERVECICGAASESPKYKGLWVQCDICDAWQHADCVGYSPKKKPLLSSELHEGADSQKGFHIKSKNCLGRKSSNDVIEMDGSYMCSLCSELIEAAQVKISTGATLIVCPSPILVQWHSEISWHTRPDSLKVCIYEGAKNISSSTTLRNEMNELATADIVLTTYDVLKEDLSHDSDRHNGDRRFMRFQKRYPVIATPLTRIHWWRLCLDEAQMVECNTASVTEMAMRLRAQHRWCVTGTPIQRKLDDIYGLLRFLRARPFDVNRWWVEVIRDPYERRDVVAMTFIHKIFKQILWRSSKAHVSEELQLPPQEECYSWLTFSPIEEHFYQKQHETCMGCANEIIRNFKNEIQRRKHLYGSDASRSDSLSHDEVAKLLFTLLKLRQACCHPQVGSSGLCSLQRDPLTMDEILDVLMGKTKIEGEEALRGIVVALNGLAGIAIIEQDNKRAVSLYREALALADENYDDFRLDPLLSLHIHHNMAELLPSNPEYLYQCPVMGAHPSGNNANQKTRNPGRFDQYYVKRRKVGEDGKFISAKSNGSLNQYKKLHNGSSDMSMDGDGGENTTECDVRDQLLSRCHDVGCLRKTCDNIKQKYLSTFVSKLSLAQQEFKNSHEQVCNMSMECKTQGMNWWLHALDFVEKDKNSSEELIKKIDQAVSTAANSSKSKVSSRIRSISGLKYTIQTGLDSLEASRQALINRIMEIDQTMDNPKDDDIERVRYCPTCSDGNGLLCVHCELNDMFQVYEARLCFLRKANNGSVITSVEEAMDMHKQKSALNRFFRNKETSAETHSGGLNSKHRLVKEDIQISRIPSQLEISLRVIKSHCKAILGRQGGASAKKQLLLFESMRKEFAQARYLSVAQAQLLGAYDEIKMSTSRLRLKESEDEPTTASVLSKEQLIPNSLQLSSDKFLSLTLLSRIRGQLRYLKGLVLSKQKTHERTHLSSKPLCSTGLAKSPLAIEESECLSKPDGEPCPICHEKLCNQKMVFPCGHVICCKCCLQLTERAIIRNGKSQQKWIMCPTCRQHTDVDQIAYVDERKNKDGSLRTVNAFESQDVSESSIAMNGSYGTKIEAVTRRILRITSSNHDAKVIVFSSWNDVLDVLQHALHANNITYVRMKGGRKSQVAIAQFKGQNISGQGGGKMEEKPSKSKPIQVLLMLIQHGANGLNILEAQHVVLVEPLLNPAAEAQAISRIHRVGQEKKTFVHRFLIKDSVEESIYKLNKSRATSSVIRARSKHKDQLVLTIRDVESLFPATLQAEHQGEATEASEAETWRHLPPVVAAGMAAERRLLQSQNETA